MNTATSQFDGHTPGEWKINAINSRTNRVVGDETSSGWDKLHITGGNRTIAVVYREADARLIAAAPELLRQRDGIWAALRSLYAEVKEYLEGDDLAAEDRERAKDRFTVSMILARAARAALASIENGALTVDLNQRLKEAADPTTSPERLAELAGDRKVGVRWWVARNPSTPAETLDRLTNDDNWTVELAAKTEATRRRTHPR